MHYKVVAEGVHRFVFPSEAMQPSALRTMASRDVLNGFNLSDMCTDGEDDTVVEFASMDESSKEDGHHKNLQFALKRLDIELIEDPLVVRSKLIKISDQARAKYPGCCRHSERLQFINNSALYHNIPNVCLGSKLEAVFASCTAWGL
eukprot:GHVH01015897.1.p2 GENE.GHVH01015897.1~~GHVH01015897.1.p2  ORF type:complete len:147 (+),score=22.21 GHVH01015897.1:801-1241(+)